MQILTTVSTLLGSLCLFIGLLISFCTTGAGLEHTINEHGIRLEFGVARALLCPAMFVH